MLRNSNKELQQSTFMAHTTDARDSHNMNERMNEMKMSFNIGLAIVYVMLCMYNVQKYNNTGIAYYFIP